MDADEHTFDDAYPPISIPITESTRDYEVFLTFPKGNQPPVRLSVLDNSFKELMDFLWYEYTRLLGSCERLYVLEYPWERDRSPRPRSPLRVLRTVPDGWERQTDDGWTPCDPYAEAQ